MFIPFTLMILALFPYICTILYQTQYESVHCYYAWPPDGLGQRGAGGGLQKLRPPCPPPSAAAHVSQCCCRALSKRAAPSAQQKRWEPPRRPGLSAAAASLPWPPGPGSLCGAAQSSICLLTSLPSALRLRGWLCGDACVSGAPPPLCL